MPHTEGTLEEQLKFNEVQAGVLRAFTGGTLVGWQELK